MAGLLSDLGDAARTLRRSPAFSATAAAVLALGIAANVTIFGLLDAALLRPLPYARAGELVMLWERAPHYAHNRVSPLNFLDWRDAQRSFSSMAAVSGGSRTLTSPDSLAERIPGQSVTAELFELLQVRAIAGRTFLRADAEAHAKAVVISERLWRTRFNADPQLVGRTIVLDGDPFTVIGVVPRTFDFLFHADLWTLFPERRTPEQRRQHYLQVVARMKPDRSVRDASEDMAGIARHIAAIAPDTNEGWGVTIEPLQTAIVGADLRTTTVVLAAVVASVLLMACANVANLLLARGMARSRELAIRAAIGGSRARLMRQLLSESLVLSAAGGAAGLLAAAIAIARAPALLPANTLPPGVDVTIDARIAIVAAVVTIVTAIVCGVAPAWQLSTGALTGALSSGGRTASAGAGRLRAALVVCEVAAAVFVAAGAGLLIRTIAALDRSDPGFHADRVLTGSVSLPIGRYPTADSLRAFYHAAERELAAIPGVSTASLGGDVPLDGWDIGQGFEIVGDPPLPRASQPSAHYEMVTPSFFRTFGIDIVRGRGFDERDTAEGRQVCIVSEAFVRRYFSGREPIGARLSVQSMDIRGGPTPVVREIVGVARQVAEQAGERQPAMQLYVPLDQNPWFSASIAVAATVEPAALAGAVRQAVAKVDRGLAVTRVRTMDEVVEEATSQPRFRARLVASFAAGALLLATVGMFSVLAFMVSQRAREFGIRIALGARTIDVLRLVAAGALTLATAGIVAGLAAAALLTRFLESLLFGVRPLDPIAFAGSAVLLAAAALAATAIPAWRAARIDPAVTLRQL